jgi:tRNA-2-methylthio-N6-dimethylallyladenosine synthase
MAKKFYIETYGCQMNVADSEVVAAILEANGYEMTKDKDDSDIVLFNTCSVRESAEKRVKGRVQSLSVLRKHKPGVLIGIMGCMAERLGADLFEQEKNVDIVVGPDAYNDLPLLIKQAEKGEKAINVELSISETYKDICPTRLENTAISGYVSIVRGCNNFCTYCIVPYTRGRERSRSLVSILTEVRDLASKGYKEITLLGQNVNSYLFAEDGKEVNFHNLLALVAETVPDLRIRFSTSHPKDMSDETLKVMAKYDNICKAVHLPVQSGSDTVLKDMNRKYTKEWYLGRIAAINKYLPNCGLSTDVFVGFHNESDEDFEETLDLMKECKFDFAYMFKYSERPGTMASKNLADNVPEEVKSSRLTKMIDIQASISAASNKADLGKEFEVLVEGVSKKRDDQLYGRTSQNKVCVFPRENYKTGDFVNIKVVSCTRATLIGELV